MHKNILPLFITSLGLITAYVFYVVWHTEEATLTNLTSKSSKTTIIKGHAYTDNKLTNVSQLPHVKNKPNTAIVMQASKTNSVESHACSFVYETPQEVEEQYEAMIPESYDDTLTQAEAAFASIDAAVLEMQERIDTPIVETEQTE